MLRQKDKKKMLCLVNSQYFCSAKIKSKGGGGNQIRRRKNAENPGPFDRQLNNRAILAPHTHIIPAVPDKEDSAWVSWPAASAHKMDDGQQTPSSLSYSLYFSCPQHPTQAPQGSPYTNETKK